MLRLTITDPSGTRTVDCDRHEVVIGRREGVDVQIADAAASRNHCVLRVDGQRLQLIDLGSVNGVSVGKQKVTEAILRPGQQFRIGKTIIRIEGSDLVLDEPETAPPVLRAPVLTGATQDFGRELRTALARTPWYIISLFIHALAILVLSQIPFTIRTKWDLTRIHAVTPNEIAEVDTELDDYEPEMPKAPEEILDDSIEEEDEGGLPPAANDEVSAADEFEADDNTLGTGEALTSRRGVNISLSPKLKKGGVAVDKSNLDREHGKAKEVVERGMGSGLKRIRGRGREIIVIRGDFDKIEKVLDKYKIKYTLVDRDDYLRRRFAKAAVVCANCARKPSSQTVQKRLADKVERFVRRGGWFLSSDWSVEPYLTRGWPEIVKVVPPRRRQPDTTVEVEPATQSPLLKKVFAHKQRTRWWLEETSTFFKVSTKATVLVRSGDMFSKYGASAVAFEFTSGRGRALHLLGHFWQEDGNFAGLVAMDQLIINFLDERFPQE